MSFLYRFFPVLLIFTAVSYTGMMSPQLQAQIAPTEKSDSTTTPTVEKLLTNERFSLAKERVPAPDFRLKSLDSTTFKTLSEHKGKVLLINFWATWCAPCRQEMPSLERLYQSLGASKSDFAILALNQAESPEIVENFVTDMGLNFTILMDETGENSIIYGVRGFPTSFLVDKMGNLVARYEGGYEFDKPVMLEIIQKLMAE